MKFLSVIIFGIVFITNSCNQKQGSDIDSKEKNEQAAETPINQILNCQINKFLEDVENYDSGGKNYVYSLEFVIDSEHISPPNTEEILLLSSLNCTYDSMAYLGSILISNCLFTIFDRYHIGNAFYNSEKLIDIPIQFLRCEQSEMRIARSFIIRDTMLFEWH